jgi:hypothetical protein
MENVKVPSTPPSSPVNHLHKESNTSVDVSATMMGNKLHFFAKHDVIVDKDQEPKAKVWCCWK